MGDETNPPAGCATCVHLPGDCNVVPDEDGACAAWRLSEQRPSVSVAVRDGNPIERALPPGWVSVVDVVDELFGGYVDIQITQDTDCEIEAASVAFNRHARDVALPLRLRFMGVRDGTAVVVPYLDTRSRGFSDEPEWTEASR